MTPNAYKMIINRRPFASTEHVLAVIPPMMYSMIASPYEVDIQGYIDGFHYPAHDNMRFNVLSLPGATKHNLTEEHTTHGKHTAYIVLRGVDIYRDHTEPGTDAYFDNSVIYVEGTLKSASKRNLVELYDLVAHEIIHVEIETLLHLAFEHRTMRLRELYETFFNADAHIYGEYFNKEAAQRALSWAFFHGDADPYPVEIIAAYAGIPIAQDVLETEAETQ